MHYGLINMFNSSVSQDIFTLLIKSLDVILTRRLSPVEFNLIFKLCNFIKPFQNAKEIRAYITKTRKYEELISLNKHELNKDPIDLIKYIVSNNITKPDRPPVWNNYQLVDDGQYKQIMNAGNPRQVFDYILSSTTEDRLKSYIDVIQRFKVCTLPQSENIFFEYYTAQSFEKGFQSLLNNLIIFSRVAKINIQKEVQMFDNLFALLKRVYKTKIDSFKNEPIEFTLETEKCQRLIKAPYTDNTFQNRRKIIELVSNLNYSDYDLTDYRDIVESVFCYRGFYQLNEDHKQFYLNNFQRLLEINPFNMMNNHANEKTILETSNSIYE